MRLDKQAVAAIGCAALICVAFGFVTLWSHQKEERTSVVLSALRKSYTDVAAALKDQEERSHQKEERTSVVLSALLKNYTDVAAALKDQEERSGASLKDGEAWYQRSEFAKLAAAETPSLTLSSDQECVLQRLPSWLCAIPSGDGFVLSGVDSQNCRYPGFMNSHSTGAPQEYIKQVMVNAAQHTSSIGTDHSICATKPSGSSVCSPARGHLPHWSIRSELAGLVGGTEDVLEMSNVARAALHSSSHFVVAELGAGQFLWLNVAAAMAKRLPHIKTGTYIAVEGNIGSTLTGIHTSYSNGICSTELQVWNNAMSSKSGDTVQFASSDGDWGYFPGVEKWCPWCDQASQDKMADQNLYTEVKTVTLSQVLESVNHVDFLDIDLQTFEVDTLMTDESIKVLQQKVKVVHIGTHSTGSRGHRGVGGYVGCANEALRPLFTSLGWHSLLDIPCLISGGDGQPIVSDGVQAWENPYLLF